MEESASKLIDELIKLITLKMPYDASAEGKDREEIVRKEFLALLTKLKGPYHFNIDEWFLRDNWEIVKSIVLPEGKELKPSYIEIHPSDICNLDCRWCKGGPRSHLIRKGRISSLLMSEVALLKLIYDIYELNPNALIRFSGFIGEPLLNPATIKAFQIVSEFGMRWVLATNGILLDNEEVRVASLNAESVTISLDAGNRETFAALKGKNPEIYDKIIKNVQAIVELKRETGAKNKIIISVILQPKNYKEISELSEKLKIIGIDMLMFRVAHFDEKGKMSRQEVDEVYKLIYSVRQRDEDDKYKVYIMQEEAEAKDMFQGIYKRPSGNQCYAALTQAAVAPDGSVYPCCNYGYGGILGVMGDINAQSLREIWNSGQRKDILARNPSKVCRYCASTGRLLNWLIGFLVEAERQQPGFIKGKKCNPTLEGLTRDI